MQEILIRLACFLAGAGASFLALILWACLMVASEEDKKKGDETGCDHG